MSNTPSLPGSDARPERKRFLGALPTMKYFRHGSLIVCLVAFAVLSSASAVRCETKAVETKAKIKLLAEVEKVLAELTAEAVKLKRNLRIEEMKKVIAEIAEVTKIDDGQKKSKRPTEPLYSRIA